MKLSIIRLCHNEVAHKISAESDIYMLKKIVQTQIVIASACLGKTTVFKNTQLQGLKSTIFRFLSGFL